MVGHSIGEVAAACVAGKLSVDDAINTACTLAEAGATRAGAMMHVWLTRTQVDGWSDEELCIAAINGRTPASNDASGLDASPQLLSVTLCGPIASEQQT